MQVSSARCCSAHAFALLAFYCSLATSLATSLAHALATTLAIFKTRLMVGFMHIRLSWSGFGVSTLHTSFASPPQIFSPLMGVDSSLLENVPGLRHDLVFLFEGGRLVHVLPVTFTQHGLHKHIRFDSERGQHTNTCIHVHPRNLDRGCNRVF